MGTGRLQVASGCTVWTPHYRLLPNTAVGSSEVKRLSDDWFAIQPHQWTSPPLPLPTSEHGEWKAALDNLRQLKSPLGDPMAEDWITMTAVEQHLEMLRGRATHASWDTIAVILASVALVTALAAAWRVFKSTVRPTHSAAQATTGGPEESPGRESPGNGPPALYRFYKPIGPTLELRRRRRRSLPSVLQPDRSSHPMSGVEPSEG